MLMIQVGTESTVLDCSAKGVASDKFESVKFNVESRRVPRMNSNDDANMGPKYVVGIYTTTPRLDFLGPSYCEFARGRSESITIARNVCWWSGGRCPSGGTGPVSPSGQKGQWYCLSLLRHTSTLTIVQARIGTHRKRPFDQQPARPRMQ